MTRNHSVITTATDMFANGEDMNDFEDGSVQPNSNGLNIGHENLGQLYL